MVDLEMSPVEERPIPEATETKKELPEQTAEKAERPKDYIEENAVQFGDEIREIKPTKLKYHRNRTAIAYRIFQLYPLSDVAAMDKGVLDPNRDGDQILFDFLCAVFDDSAFVSRHYDDLTAPLLDKIVEIFCRINGITEKEEAAKNRAAKGTTH